MRTVRYLVVILVAALCVGASAAIINPGTEQWVQAARTQRADMLILSDSVAWHGGDGWDAGFIQASANTLGVAGTGLTTNSAFTGEGEGYSSFGSWNGWSESASSAPPGKESYVWRNQLVSAASTPVQGFGWGVADGTNILDPQGAMQLHLWHDSPSAGTLGYYKRLGYPPFSTVHDGPTIPTLPNPVGLTHSVLTYPAEPSGAAGSREFFLKDTTNTSIFYSRLTQPGATGVTVTSWGLGGQSTYAFHQMYTSWSQPARLAWLNALVDGGSGKLNVLIAQGFNDRNETRTSLGGNLDGDSPEAFADNVRALMSAIRSDWTGAGKPLDDLSFTLLGMYDIAGGEDAELRGYAAQLSMMAAADPQASFVDLYELSPHYAEANAAGYLVDGLHPSREGAMAYSSTVMSAIVPEPVTVSLLAPLALLLLLRRRLKQA